MRLRRVLIAIVAIVVLVPAGLFGFLYVMQDRLLYPGADAAMPFGALAVKRPDRVLHGWVQHPEATDALVVFGGNGMSLSRFAPRLAACSTRAVYLLPYRGYEGQAGSPREKGMVADGLALMAEAQAKHAHVAILGISLGSGIATEVAAGSHPDRLVLVTPYDNMAKVGSEHLGGLPLGWLMHDAYDAADAAHRLGDVPVAILQATHDEVIGAARTEALVSALPKPPMRRDRVDADHNGILRADAFCSALAF